MRNIAIVKLSAIGDIIHLTTLLPSIKNAHPEIKITWVVDEKHSSFLKLFNEIDKVITINWTHSSNPFRQIYRIISKLVELRKVEYQTVIDAQGLFRSGLIARLIKSKKTIGFNKQEARELSSWFYSHRIKKELPLNVIDKYIMLFKEIGVTEVLSKLPKINYPSNYQLLTRQFFEKHSTKIKKKILFNPSSSYYTKEMPTINIIAIAKEVFKTFKEPLILLVNPDNAKLAKKNFSHYKEILLSPLMKIDQLFDFISQVNFFIGMDSGPSYIGYITKTPTLILFGPTNLHRQAPNESTLRKGNHLSKKEIKTMKFFHSIYSNYDCPIIKKEPITTAYRCLNKKCSDNQCIKKFNEKEIVNWIKKNI